MDVIRQALEYPGNLTATAASAATDLVSGMLEHVTSDLGIVRKIDDGAQKLESKHQFKGWLISRPAVS
jgi:Cu/Ag efflux protein CusF